MSTMLLMPDRLLFSYRLYPSEDRVQKRGSRDLAFFQMYQLCDMDRNGHFSHSELQCLNGLIRVLLGLRTWRLNVSRHAMSLPVSGLTNRNQFMALSSWKNKQSCLYGWNHHGSILFDSETRYSITTLLSSYRNDETRIVMIVCLQV